jgi:hypothetical protein
MFNPKITKDWDKLIKGSELISLDGSKSYGIMYMSNKKQFTISSRDFYEKIFMFFHNGKLYRYSSSVANCEQAKPPPPDTVRGKTMYNCGIMYRSEKDKKIYYDFVNQCDFKLSVPAFMINSFLPKAAKGWINDI